MGESQREAARRRSGSLARPAPMGTRSDSRRLAPPAPHAKDAVTAVEPRTGALGGRTARASARRSGRYVALTKPRIIELLLVTTFPTMILAASGLPVAVAGRSRRWSAARWRPASANTLNCYLDRDIDKMMHRTEQPPAGDRGDLARARRCVFGVVLGVAVRRSGWGCWSTGCPRPCRWRAIVFYVVVYTMLLKRRTSQNIVWGGAAGCMPVLIGWSAVTGSLSWARAGAVRVIFFWTPPHYWPLSMRFKDDYAAAGVPMLPVVAQDVAVARQIVALLAGRWSPRRCCSCRCAGMGWSTLVAAVVAGGRVPAWRRTGCSRRARRPGVDHGVAQADAAVPLLDHATSRCSSSPSRSTRSCTCRSEAEARPPEAGERAPPSGRARRGRHARPDTGRWASTHLEKERPMPTRTARTAWTGSLQEGSGRVELEQLPRRLVRRVVPQAGRRGRRRDDESRGAHRGRALLPATPCSCSALVAEAGWHPAVAGRDGERLARPGPGRRVPAHGDRARRCAGRSTAWPPTGSPGRPRRPRRPAR